MDIRRFVNLDPGMFSSFFHLITVQSLFSDFEEHCRWFDLAVGKPPATWPRNECVLPLPLREMAFDIRCSEARAEAQIRYVLRRIQPYNPNSDTCSYKGSEHS